MSTDLGARAVALALLAAASRPALALGPGDPPGPSGDAVTTDVVLLVAYVSLALLFSFMCSIAEAVLLSITPSFIEGLRTRRPRQAALLQRLKQTELDRSLASILTLNTIAHTVGAIAAGAQAAKVMGSAWLGLFSAVTTLLILFLSEIIPKTIGAVHWSRLAVPTAHVVRALIVVLYPLVLASEKLTRVVSHGKAVHIFSRDELAAMTRIGEQSGQIDRSESRIIQSLLRFRGLAVTDIMTPRTVIAALPQQATVAEALEFVESRRFTRMPVFGRDLDDVVGFVRRDEVLHRAASGGGDEPLAALRRDIAAVPETTTLPTLLDRLLERREHVAVVLDEYGGTSGLVTLEDLVETLLGVEIVDETDTVEDMQLLARKLWRERAKTLDDPPPAPDDAT